jgi:hypothetical protein
MKGFLLGVAVAVVMAFATGMARADNTANAGSAAGANSGSESGAEAVVNLHSNSFAVKQDYPASATASLLIQACQEGVSAQGIRGGIAAGFDSAQCTAIRQAAVHLEMYDRYFGLKMYEQANKELAKFHEYIADADRAADVGHYPKIAGGAVTSVLPIALLWLVF